MNLSNINENDLFGRFSLKKPDSVMFDTYYQSIEALRPLLTSEAWSDNVTGYYINVAGNMDTVRLSYFTSNPDGLLEVVENYCQQNNIEKNNQEQPHAARIAEAYGGEELRFRKYLHAYTQIGLDLIQENLLQARCLMATFRWQVMLSRQPYKPHFENIFEAQSSAYNSLSPEEKEQFWLDLSNWPDTQQVDWAHMMVNMILPGDFVQQWNLFSQPRPAKSIDEINTIMERLGFQIPNTLPI